jgi:hypothetical protein
MTRGINNIVILFRLLDIYNPFRSLQYILLVGKSWKVCYIYYNTYCKGRRSPIIKNMPMKQISIMSFFYKRFKHFWYQNTHKVIQFFVRYLNWDLNYKVVKTCHDAFSVVEGHITCHIFFSCYLSRCYVFKM